MWATLQNDFQAWRNVQMTEICMVFFRAGTCDLAGAAASLREHGLDVSQVSDVLVASSAESPQFRILVSSAPHVQTEACEIAVGTPHEAAMRECTARFEIEFDDLDEALDEINTLIEVQAALQEASNGYLFVPWSGQLCEP